MPVSEVTNEAFFESCLKHCEVDWEAVCKETGLTSNAAKKRWKRFMEKQGPGTTDGTKTPKQSGTAKGTKRVKDDEETPVKKPRKTPPKKTTKAKDEEDEIAAEDDEEERV